MHYRTIGYDNPFSCRLWDTYREHPQRFYSTMVVNLMNWNKAYSMFSLSKFVQYKGYHWKLWAAAFCYETILLEGGICMNACAERCLNPTFRRCRWVGDEFIWTISYETKNVQWSKIADHVLEYASCNMYSQKVKVYEVVHLTAC